ncbi:MAG: hydrogenase maturation protease [Desulfitobacteriia bacterium]
MVNSEKVIVVDALQGGGPPGTFYLLPADKLFLDHESGLFRHEDDFFSVLECLKCYNTRTELIIVGVEPLEISYSLELSPQIKQRIPDLIELILNLCRDSKLNSSLNQQNSK